MCNREKIFQKIKKLLALSKSSNENEACTAIQKAQALMKEFSLTESEVLLHSIVEKSTKATSRSSPWRNIIANTIAEMYCCGVYRSLNEVIFIGEEIDVFMASEVYSYLQKSILRIARNKIRKNAKTHYRESFKKGLAFGISDKLLSMNEPLWRSKEGKAKLELVKKYMNELELVEVKAKKQRTVNLAYTKGFLSRDDISLNNQVNTTQEKQKMLEI